MKLTGRGMVQIECLGVGEACDGDNFNSAFLITGPTNFLIDCGFAIPSRIFSKRLDPNFIDAVYLSHSHADHIFGIPAFLLDLKTRKRTKPLAIIGQPGTAARVKELTELAYSTVISSLPFELNYIETVAPVTFQDTRLAFARTDHPRSNFAIRIEFPTAAIGLSGDGNMTEQSLDLFRSCTTVIHEAYRVEPPSPGHTVASELLAAADSWPNLKQLAMVHLQADERSSNLAAFQKLISGRRYSVLIPEPGEILCDG